MFRLLKQLRNDPQVKRKIFKYAIYAIGEIVLVVIGILIAVSIDDWNESRKKREAFAEILNEISKDLEEDIWQYEFQTRNHYYSDSVLRRITSRTLTENDYLNNWQSLRTLVIANVFFYPHKNGFQSLQKNLEDAPPELIPLINDITNYYVFKVEGVMQTLNREDRLAWKNLEDMESKYPWYAHYVTDTSINKDAIEYFVTSHDYFNKAATFLTNCDNVITLCEESRIDGLELLKRIRATAGFRQDSFIKDVVDLLAIDDSTSLKPCTVPDSISEARSNSRFRVVYLITNNKQEELTLYEIGNEENTDTKKIDPLGLILLDGYYGQHFRIVDANNRCMGVFSIGKSHSVVNL